MLKIRLRRMGAIRQPHYRIVVADARAPRDGRFFETLGHYNPLTDPATIHVDIAKYEDWKKKGAQPTDAVASLVKRYNRMSRAGLVAPQATRKGAPVAPVAQVAAAAPETVEAASTSDSVDLLQAVDTAALETGPTESGTHMNEAMAEATRDDGEGSEALTGGGAPESASDTEPAPTS
ncbi:MAG: 30S ribosomal protein S16 [Chloroflexota bacterium]|nr:30S ribosomal protein S16 [Chloroflexota bacterium]